MQSEFSIINKTSTRIPSLPFLAVKNDILGRTYNLSIAFVDEKTSYKINKTYRKKDKGTNILSFVLSPQKGEIVLCPSIIKNEAKDKNKNYSKNYRELLLFLVIHGMLHLKGMQHGSIMEKKEKFYYKKYDQKHFDRNRYRLKHDESHSGRIRKGRKKS